jgi:hypothetical protein
MPPSRNVHVHWMTLMKNQNAQKCQNFKKRVVRQRTHFLNHLTKKYVQWVQSVLGVGHMCKK